MLGSSSVLCMYENLYYHMAFTLQCTYKTQVLVIFVSFNTYLGIGKLKINDWFTETFLTSISIAIETIL